MEIHWMSRCAVQAGHTINTIGATSPCIPVVDSCERSYRQGPVMSACERLNGKFR